MSITPRFPWLARATRAGLALALFAATAGAALGQAAKTAKPTAPPVPLSSYAPDKGLFLYAEFEGTRAHADAWKKTSAYQILNDTPTGKMLEGVVGQLLGQTVLKDSGEQNADVHSIVFLEHVAANGILMAGWNDPAQPAKEPSGLVVVRDAFKDQEARTAIARFLGKIGDPKVKPKLVDVAGHKIVMVKLPKGEFCGWWVDDVRKADLLFILPMKTEAGVTEAAAAVFDTIEGKTPGAAKNATRVALFKEEDGFVPAGIAFVDLSKLPPIPSPPDLGLQGIKSLDYRWGFQEKELVSIARLAAPKPRTGLLSILDQPTFDKTGLPPIPDGVTEFSVFTLDLAKTYDQITAMAKAINPQAGAQVEAMNDAVKAKTRLRLKEDILAHIGPKFAMYNAPNKSGSDKAAVGSPLSMMLGGASIPRMTIIAEIDNPTAFGKALDELMIVVNQTLRTSVPGMPGGDPAKGAAKAKAGGSGLEFKMIPGGGKTFMLSIPQELASFVPTYIRPTIRVGPKHVVFSLAADSARAALEVKGGGAPETTFASILQTAPTNLVFLSVNDPSDSLSQALASFPGKLQVAMNKGTTPAQGGTNQPGQPGGPGQPGANPYAGGPGSGSGPGSIPSNPGAGSGGPPAGYPGAGSGGPPAGYPGSGSGVPGAPNSGGPGVGDAAGAGSGIVFRIRPENMPTAAAIKPMIAPASTAVAVDDGGLRIVTRQSFPDLGSLVSGASLNSIIAQQIKPGGTPGMPIGPGGAPAGPGGRGPNDRKGGLRAPGSGPEAP